MVKIIERLNRFNYTKAGVVTGFILGALTAAMGVLFIGRNVGKNHLTVFCSFATLAIGVFAICMEVYRARKMRQKNNKQ
jgi:hypothetical protein